MPDHEPPISLGLNAQPAESAAVIRPEELQFDHAVPLNPTAASATICVACKSAIPGQYFHAQGRPVCPRCAHLIEAGQQAPPPISLLPAFLYGAGAAFVGFLIYALVAIIFDLELGLISILVGIMVGKAVRKGSKGLGGRPQQIMAVALTYFAITFSYIPVYINQMSKSPKQTAAQQQSTQPSATIGETGNNGDNGDATRERPSLGAAIAILCGLALAAPFLSLGSGVSGILSLVIIFFGLSRAWKLTGRSDLVITGPYGPNTV